MPLRARLVLAAAAVALVALVVADVATYSWLRSFLAGATDRSLEQAATSLLAGPGLGGPGGPTAPPGAGREPGHIQSLAPGLFVEMRSSTGAVVVGPYPAHEQGGASYSPVLPAHIAGLSSGSPRVLFSAPSVEKGGPELEVLAQRAPDGEVLVVAMSVASNASTLDHLVLIELVVTAATLAAAVLLGLWLVRVGLRPLTQVEAAAERITEGGLGQRVPGDDGRSEVGRLARALNVMLGRIEQAFDERDATESALRRSEERLRRFVADASHELRTPLAAVSAYAELFERGARDRPEDLERLLAGVRAETARMQDLVEDLLLLARLDEGRPLALAPVDLSALAGEAVRTARTLGPGWPVELSAPGPLEVTGDEVRLRQVLDNLLANVRAHTPPGTPTAVTVSRRAEGAVVEVADRGPGMSAEECARAFERFYRADPSRSRAHGGTGLGLSIVAAIVAAHGGQVAARPRDGSGLVVTVTVPPTPCAPTSPCAPPTCATT
jgi:two-component system, OmpR family, sensor kinase